MMTVKFSEPKEVASGKLADVELHFTAGPLVGLKLIGLALWASKQNPGTFNVTMPARQYSVNGERRSFALLRPSGTADAPSLKDAVVAAWIDKCRAEAEAVIDRRCVGCGDVVGNPAAHRDCGTGPAAEGDDSSAYKPEAAALYDGTPGSASLPRPRKGGAR